MIFKSLLRWLLSCVINIFVHVVVGVIILVVVPGIPPYSSFESFDVTPAINLDGKWVPKNVLDKAVKLVDGELRGAESIALDGDTLYMGVAGGKVVKLTDNDDASGRVLEVIAYVGKLCGGKTSQKFCELGVPAGIRLNSKKTQLILVDCANGIANINLKTGKVRYYFTNETLLIDDNPSTLTFPNDLDIAEDGTIIWSQFASEYTMEEFSLDKCGDSSGRLLKYNPRTKEHSVLLQGLFGANGVQLSTSQEFVLVGESFKSRVLRYYLKGDKAGTSDVFADGLPGLVDNIRPNGRGGFYVALFAPRLALIDELSQYSWIRKFIFRLQWITVAPLRLLKYFGIQDPFVNHLREYVGNLGSYGMQMLAKPMVVDLDASGNILRVLTTTNKEMRQVTQITVGEKFAYMGGFLTQQIWKIDLKHFNKGLNK